MGPRLKNQAIPDSNSQERLDVWADLCSILTVEEGNALYHSMKEVSYQGEQPIFTQGEQNSNLYFIRQGQLRILYSKGGREVFLKMLRPGEIIGEDTFFSNSVCTTTVMPFSYARLIYLEKNVLQEWKGRLPALESKLHAYCLKFEKINDLLQQKGLDRRAHERFKICGKAILQILSLYGSSIGKTFDADLWDISASGLSCFVRLSKHENARFLLGCALSIELAIPAGEDILKIGQKGTIVAVGSNPFEHYSLHVKFDELLEPSFMKDLKRFAVAPSCPGL